MCQQQQGFQLIFFCVCQYAANTNNLSLILQPITLSFHTHVQHTRTSPVPDHIRPRVCSLPERPYNPRQSDDLYRLRTFSISKGTVVNCGDSIISRRSRSNTSVNSTNSRFVSHYIIYINDDETVSASSQHATPSYCCVFMLGAFVIYRPNVYATKYHNIGSNSKRVNSTHKRKPRQNRKRPTCVSDTIDVLMKNV